LPTAGIKTEGGFWNLSGCGQSIETSKKEKEEIGLGEKGM
jgi:hypothetical protein